MPDIMSTAGGVSINQNAERQRHHKRASKLAWRVAYAMDGTKCDDELCVTYQKSLPELVELVKKYTKREVVSLYSTSDDHP